MGGQLVEVFRDRALGLPPLNTTLARRLIERTRIATALRGVRGRRPVDLDELASLLVRFSELVAEQPRIAEIDVNPLLASPERIIALDARVVLHPSSIPDRDLPRLAIRPYPRRYTRSFRDARGDEITIRPIRPEDEPALVRFHQTLSPETVRARYGTDFALAERTAHERLTRISFVDYDREIALVAEARDKADADGGRRGDDEEEIVGVARLSPIHATDDKSLSLVVADAWQRRGIGRQLVASALDVARREGVDEVLARLSPANTGMRTVLADAGFALDERDGMLRAARPARDVTPAG